jgi:hypothetical protein
VSQGWATSAQPHQSGTLERGPRRSSAPKRGLAPGRRLRMPQCRGAVGRSTENKPELPLATHFPLSSQGPDSKRLCPICMTTTRPLAIGASTQPTGTKESYLNPTEAPYKCHLLNRHQGLRGGLFKQFQPAVYQGPGPVTKVISRGRAGLTWGCRSKES